MHSLNLGILAHVDAGKTSLTERLLFAAGVIDQIGRVDDGSTQTDSLALERQRGITIKAAVASFRVGDLAVNLIDTPGHPDFIAEVERSLAVLDGAVLVVSAVEGVQAQTRVLMRTLRRLRIPVLVFINKIDRGGAQPDRVLAQIAARLTPAVVAMGTVTDPGTRGATCWPIGPGDAEYAARLADVLTEHDDALLAAYVADDRALPYAQLRAALAAQTRRALVHPVYFGSAITGAGIDSLTAGTRRIPAGGVRRCGRRPQPGRCSRSSAGPRARRSPTSGCSPARCARGSRCPTVPDARERSPRSASCPAGLRLRALRWPPGRSRRSYGLPGVQIGDTVGPAAPTRASACSRRRPWRASSSRRSAADRPALYAALTELAEQDPLINLRQDDVRHELLVSLYGEVQKEVIQATLADEFGLARRFPRDHDDLRRAAGRHRRRRGDHGHGRQPVPCHRRPAHRARTGRVRHCSSGWRSSLARCRWRS